MTVDKFSHRQSDGSIGQVREIHRNGLMRKNIGQAQAWFYPVDATLVLWECLLDGRYRSEPPIEDALLDGLWGTWERWLIGRCPQVQLIAAKPNWTI